MIHLTTPCNENWDKMTPVDGGRHCGSCDKVITDYTKMTDEEIIAHMNSSGTGCAHFRADQVQDGTSYEGWKFYAKWKAAVALLMIGSVFMVSCRRQLSGAYHTNYQRVPHKKNDSTQQGRRTVRTQFLIDDQTEQKFDSLGSNSDSDK